MQAWVVPATIGRRRTTGRPLVSRPGVAYLVETPLTQLRQKYRHMTGNRNLRNRGTGKIDLVAVGRQAGGLRRGSCDFFRASKRPTVGSIITNWPVWLFLIQDPHPTRTPVKGTCSVRGFQRRASPELQCSSPCRQVGRPGCSACEPE